MALLTVSGLVFLLFFLALLGFSECRNFNDVLRFPSQSASFVGKEEDDPIGTRWAVLIAGSSGYGNYRHQADVCHSYQIMKRGGLKDENIIVFMYDDIAYHEDNPRPGVIINNPYGENVYAGVPKDYVGVDVTVDNFFAVLLGNKSSLKGGSGKVVNSGPNDHIFIFYSDHGGPGVLGMPTYPYLYANDLVDVLKRKHSSKSYKSMVFYLEACESGSIFEGLLPENLNIYATTAANAQENSWGTYCPGQFPSPPPEYDTCLGDMYSVSWMEDSDVHNLRTEKLKQQYHLVKSRTANLNAHGYSSHVMQYGNIDLSDQALFLYMGTNPANENSSFIVENRLPPFLSAMNQRDADLLYLWRKFQKFPEGSNEKRQAEKQLLDVISLRVHVDSGMELIGSLLFGPKGKQILGTVQPSGKPLVNNWDCLKAMVQTFETYCGSLSQDGMKHMRSFANICNAGVQVKTMVKVASQACRSIPSTSWSSISKGFSA